MNFFKMGKNDLIKIKSNLLKQYTSLKNMNLKISMARGVPSVEQINLSSDILDIINSKSSYLNEDGTDCRNYGGTCGIPEARRLLAPLMGVNENDVIVGGNSSLEMMFDCISMFMTHGISGFKPWIKQEKVKFLCPSPGYDRHFKICEYFGIEQIIVGMTPDGPNMDQIENFLKNDPHIKGIWCVPKYSNPQGITYSDETVKKMASLTPLSKDFRIFWDNAYSVHDLTDQETNLLSIMDECKKNNNEELPIIFCSTSKITFAGDGIAAMACRGTNAESLKERYSVKSVGPDKLNQLRHVKFLKDLSTIKNHMRKHRDILSPKFELVKDILKEHFSNNPIIKWSNPKGGYFISINTENDCAKRTVELCKEAGVILTPAGATYPYGINPDDNNIRIAPSFLNKNDLSKAMSVFCIAAKISYIERVTS